MITGDWAVSTEELAGIKICGWARTSPWYAPRQRVGLPLHAAAGGREDRRPEGEGEDLLLHAVLGGWVLREFARLQSLGVLQPLHRLRQHPLELAVLVQEAELPTRRVTLSLRMAANRHSLTGIPDVKQSGEERNDTLPPRSPAGPRRDARRCAAAAASGGGA